MKLKSFISLGAFGIKTVLFKMKKPILGTIILTDFCNLSCKHCSVNNINKVMYPYDDIVEEMNKLYNEGIRILFSVVVRLYSGTITIGQYVIS